MRNFNLQAASASMASLDVYCFGHILYEITFGQSLLSPTADEYPPHCPDIISKLLASCVFVKITKLHILLYFFIIKIVIFRGKPHLLLTLIRAAFRKRQSVAALSLKNPSQESQYNTLPAEAAEKTPNRSCLFLICYLYHLCAF
jgi:hypothetical protein